MTDSRKAIISIVAAVVVVGVVVGMVLAFAVIPLPDFPALGDDPDPSISGTVAFAHSDNGDLCISTIPAGGGESREVMCDDNIGFGEFAPGWTPDGMLVVQEYRGVSERFRIVDPVTGETVDRVPLDQPDEGPTERGLLDESADGSMLLTEFDSGSPRVWVENSDGVERTILEVEGPRDYGFESATWSPDGAWILLHDSEGRLIIASAQGDADPRVLTEEADGWRAAAWFMPGYSEGTWDPRS